MLRTWATFFKYIVSVLIISSNKKQFTFSCLKHYLSFVITVFCIGDRFTN